MNADMFIGIIQNKREEKQREVKRGVLQNDLTKAHMALGGEMVCDDLERSLKYHLEAAERIRQEKERSTQAATLRRSLRQKQREDTAA